MKAKVLHTPVFIHIASKLFICTPKWHLIKFFNVFASLKVWCCFSWCTASRTTGILWGYYIVESWPEAYYEKRRHLLLYEHNKRREFSFCRSSKSAKPAIGLTTKGRLELKSVFSIFILSLINPQNALSDMSTVHETFTTAIAARHSTRIVIEYWLGAYSWNHYIHLCTSYMYSLGYLCFTWHFVSFTKSQ